MLNVWVRYSPCWPTGVLLGFFCVGRLGDDSGRGATGWMGLVCFADSLLRLTCLFSIISWTSSSRFRALSTLPCKPISKWNGQKIFFKSWVYQRYCSVRRTFISSDRTLSYWLWRFLSSVTWFFSADSKKCWMSIKADSAPSWDWHLSTAWEASR